MNKRFSSDFRGRVATVVKSGVAARVVASTLGVPLGQVQKWATKYAKRPKKLTASQAQKELALLKSQLRQALEQRVFDDAGSSSSGGVSWSTSNAPIILGSGPALYNPASPVDGTNEVTYTYTVSNNVPLVTLSITNNTGPSIRYDPATFNPTIRSFKIGGKQPFPLLGFLSQELQVTGTDQYGNTLKSNIRKVQGKALLTAAINQAIAINLDEWGQAFNYSASVGLGGAVTDVGGPIGLSTAQIDAVTASFIQYLGSANSKLTLSAGLNQAIQDFPTSQNKSVPFGYKVGAGAEFSSGTYSGWSVNGGMGFQGIGGANASTTVTLGPIVTINWTGWPQVNINVTAAYLQQWQGSKLGVNMLVGVIFNFQY